MISRATIRIAVFLAGATLMALEVAAFRIVGRTFGTALRETTTVIAVFMAAMSIGYWGGGLAGDRWPTRRTLAAILLFAGAAIVLIPTLDAFVSPRISSSSASLSLHAFLATTILFFVPTLFLAAVTPIAVRLFASETTQSGKTAGSVSALSTVGSIVGTILSAFVLLDWLKSIDRTVLVLAATTLMTTIIVLATQMTRKIALTAAVAVGVVIIGAWIITTPGGRRDPNLLFVRDSPYHLVMVGKHGVFRTLTFNWLRTEALMDVRDPYGPGLDYINDAHIAKLLQPSARTMLAIGLGGGSVVKQFARLYPEMLIDVAEIDPVVVEVAARFFFVAPSPRLRIHTMDGRVFLRTSGDQRWDLIYIDSYTVNRYGSTIPPHLVTREFFQEVKRHLTPRGYLSFHCFTPIDAPMARALHKTLTSEFPTVLVFTGGPYTEFFATTAMDVPTKQELMARARPLPWTDMRSRVATLVEHPLSSADDPILTDDYAPVDTLLRRQ